MAATAEQIIRHRDPAPSAARVDPAGRTDGTLAGRTAELAIVESALSDVAAGRGRVLVVRGEPGIGKTRLLDEIATRAGSRGLRVARAAGAQFECDLPMGVIGQALAELGADAPARGTMTEIERFQTYRPIRNLLESASGERPLALLLDDLHWADAMSSELLAYLIRRWPDGPVLGVLAYRAARARRTLDGAVAAGLKDGLLECLDLAPLTACEADEMLGPELPPAARGALHRATGGNPLFLRELAREASEPGDGNAAAVPTHVRWLIDDELSALTRTARLFLHGAAVAGDPFDHEVAGRVAGIHERAIALALDEVVRHGFVQLIGISTPCANPDGREPYAFRSPVLRRAVYQSSGAGWRLGAHARAAETLAARGCPITVRARHVEQSARSGDAAAAALLECAAREVAGRDPALAARWYAASLRALPDDAGAAHRVEVRLRLAGAYAACGEIAKCRAELAECSDRRGSVVATMARIRHRIAERVDVSALLAAERGANASCAAALQLELSVEHHRAGDWDAMAAWANAAREAARTRPQSALAAALLALAHHEQGATMLSRRQADAAAALTDGLEDSELAECLDALVYLGQVDVAIGRHRLAAQRIERGIELAQATGQTVCVAPLNVTLGCAQLALGHLREAFDAAGRAVELCRNLHVPRMLSEALAFRCAAALRRGHLATAVEAGSEAVDLAGALDGGISSASAGCWLGQALIDSGDCDEGIARIIEHGGGPSLPALSAGARSCAFAAMAEAEADRGSIEAADRWVRATEIHAQEVSLRGAAADARRARASLLLAQGEPSAIDLAIAAASDYGRLDQPVERARAGLVAGRALARAGRRDEALVRLRRAHAALDARGARRYRDQASRELRALGRTVVRNDSRRARSASGSMPLSARELEVAELVALGHTNRRIAAELCLSERTVETHLSHIFAKLEVSSRTEVAAWWGAM